MKTLSIVLALTAASSAQIASYNAVGKAIAAQVQSLNALITAYTGGVASGSAIVKQGNVLLTAINNGANSAKGFDKLPNLTVALGLLDVYGLKGGLAGDVQTVISNLIKKTAVVSKDNLCSTAEALLQQELSAAQGLEAVIVSKLAGLDADSIATNSVIAPINAAINSGIAAYGPCAKAGGGGGGSTPPQTTSGGGGGGSNPPTTTTPGGGTTTQPTCTSEPINTKQIKKCLKIISQAALNPPAGGYGEL